jgi:hypothetical protein
MSDTQDSGAAAGQLRQEPEELDGVAEALFAMQDDGLAVDVLARLELQCWVETEERRVHFRGLQPRLVVLADRTVPSHSQPKWLPLIA